MIDKLEKDKLKTDEKILLALSEQYIMRLLMSEWINDLHAYLYILCYFKTS